MNTSYTSCEMLHIGAENAFNVWCHADAARRRPYPLIAHCSQLITQKSVASASSVCQWKFFTKPYFCINPAGKSKVPSWKIFISLLENYFFSVGKSNFRSRAILDDFFGSLLNYFKRFLFILKPCAVRLLKVKMFDSEWWAISCECFSTKEQKDIIFYETHSSKPSGKLRLSESRAKLGWAMPSVSNLYEVKTGI